MDGALSLEQHGLLGRFDASAEAEYQRWLVQRLRPLGTAIAAPSILAWILVPFAVRLAPNPPDDMTVIYVVSWGVDIPLIAAYIAYAWLTPARRAVLLGAVLVSVIAVGAIGVIGTSMPDVHPVTFLASATFFAVLIVAAQVPFRTALFVEVLVTATGLLAAAAATDDVWEQNFVIGTLGLCMSSLLIGPAVAFVGESRLRATFADERTIERQQALLEESRALIRRYAPGAVAARIELGDRTVDHPQRRKVTVFFSDVVGFTELADRVDPEALAEIVNDYLGSLADLIERHGGTLNEFAGDGVMALFGAPDEMDPTDQVRAAVGAARELQDLLPRWSRGWYQHGILADAQARVGINTGMISVGTFGSAVRATYTGIGLQTNIAARVQAEAEPGGILLSNTSWHLVKDEIDCEPRGEVLVKGVHFPIELYAPRD